MLDRLINIQTKRLIKGVAVKWTGENTQEVEYLVGDHNVKFVKVVDSGFLEIKVTAGNEFHTESIAKGEYVYIDAVGDIAVIRSLEFNKLWEVIDDK
jgi:hypothetical protein